MVEWRKLVARLHSITFRLIFFTKTVKTSIQIGQRGTEYACLGGDIQMIAPGRYGSDIPAAQAIHFQLAGDKSAVVGVRKPVGRIGGIYTSRRQAFMLKTWRREV